MALAFSLTLSWATSSIASPVDPEKDAFFEEWQTMLPVVARNLEYCVLPPETVEFCGQFALLRDDGFESSSEDHFRASVFVLASFNNLLSPLGQKYASEMNCSKPAVEGEYLTSVLKSGEFDLVVRVSENSCYLEILDGPYAS